MTRLPRLKGKELVRLLDGHDVARFLDDAHDVVVAPFVETERTQVALGDVEAPPAPRDAVLGVFDRACEPLRIGRVDLQQVERDALRRLGPDAGQTTEFVDERLHDAFVGIHETLTG